MAHDDTSLCFPLHWKLAVVKIEKTGKIIGVPRFAAKVFTALLCCILIYDQVKESKMSGTCSMHVRKWKCKQNVDRKKWKEQSQYRGVDTFVHQWLYSP
jgi:hypothetical protein